MTSNGNLNASLDTSRSPRNDSGDAVQPAPKVTSPSAKENVPVTQNGDHDDNESEAETVVLSRDDESREKKVIKTERDEDEPARLESIKENTHSHSPRNSRRRSSDVKTVKSNGHAKDGSDDAKSPVPTSPSTASRQTKDTSPAGSPARPTLSPTQTTTRGRSASTVESRKRKLRDEFGKLEPPRQKAKTEGLKDRTQPNSPATVRFSYSLNRWSLFVNSCFRELLAVHTSARSRHSLLFLVPQYANAGRCQVWLFPPNATRIPALNVRLHHELQMQTHTPASSAPHIER